MPLFRKSNGKSTLFRSINADLRLAAGQGDVVETLDLLKKGAKFIPNKEGRTALHLAVINAHTNVVQILIEHGCDLNHKDKLGYTALHRACFEGYEDIVRLLLDANAKVDEQDAVQENTALHEAAWRGHSGCVELLLKAKANVYVRNKIGATPLHLACQNGYNLSCRLLLQHGCKTNVKDKYDDTPLHTACRYLHLGVARILLSETTSNTNTNEQNKNGDTPLHLSCNLGQKKLSKMLIEHEARVDVKNKQGETPLDIAVRKQQLELVQIIQQRSLKIDKRQKPGQNEKKTKSKIRERLKHSQDPESSWKLLFQDSVPSPCYIDGHGASGGGSKHSTPTTCHTLEQSLSAYPSPGAVPIASPVGEREPLFVDTPPAVISTKGQLTCYCAPLFYRMAKHNDEAHRELLEEIDACHTNLNDEICDLRQLTERKLVDLNRVVKVRMEKERTNCSQRMLKYIDQVRSKKSMPADAADSSPSNHNQRFAAAQSKSKLIRSKSESELETDVERERVQADDSDSASNASEDAAYFDKYLLLHRQHQQRHRNHVTTLNRKHHPTGGKHAPSPKAPLGGGGANSFDETVRQFNKIDSETLNDSSCTTPTTASSGGHVRGTPARISLYSCQSNQSASSQQTTSSSAANGGGKFFQQPPSVDSGYGTKVENSPVHLSFPSQSSTVDGLNPTGSLRFFDFSTAVNNSANNAAVMSAFRPILPTAKFGGVVEAETQTAKISGGTTAGFYESHEYTELECILRSAGGTNNVVGGRPKPPPVLPIPPPPRKPLPPLPAAAAAATDHHHRHHGNHVGMAAVKKPTANSRRQRPVGGCLSTNV